MGWVFYASVGLLIALIILFAVLYALKKTDGPPDSTPCKEQADCETFELCKDGFCIVPECKESVDCDMIYNHELCIDNECVAQESPNQCNTNEDCGDPELRCDTELHQCVVVQCGPNTTRQCESFRDWCDELHGECYEPECGRGPHVPVIDADHTFCESTPGCDGEMGCVCLRGRCEEPECRTSDDCDDDLQCDLDTYECAHIVCNSTDIPCHDPEYSFCLIGPGNTNGICTYSECKNNTDCVTCHEGEKECCNICVDEKCIPADCGLDCTPVHKGSLSGGCPLHKICISNLCIDTEECAIAADCTASGAQCLHGYCHYVDCTDSILCSDQNTVCIDGTCTEKGCTTPGIVTEKIDENGETYYTGCNENYQVVEAACNPDPLLPPQCVEGTCDHDTFQCDIGECGAHGECDDGQHCVKKKDGTTFCTRNNCEIYDDESDNCHDPEKFWCPRDEEGQGTMCEEYTCKDYGPQNCKNGDVCDPVVRKCVNPHCNVPGVPSKVCPTGFMCYYQLCEVSEECGPGTATPYKCPDSEHVCTKTTDNPPKYLCHDSCSNDPASDRACHDEYFCVEGRCERKDCDVDDDCAPYTVTIGEDEFDEQLSSHCINHICEVVGCIDDEECNDKWSAADQLKWKCLANGTCEHVKCTSNADCTDPSHKICDTVEGHCRHGCLADSDCTAPSHRCDSVTNECIERDCYPGKSCPKDSVCSYQFIYGCPLKSACNSRGECVKVGPKDHKMIMTPGPGHWEKGKHDDHMYLSFKKTDNLEIYESDHKITWNTSDSCAEKCSADPNCISALLQIDYKYSGHGTTLHCHFRKTDKLLHEGDIQYDSKRARYSTGYENRLQFELWTKKFITDK